MLDKQNKPMYIHQISSVHIKTLHYELSINKAVQKIECIMQNMLIQHPNYHITRD